MLKVSFEHAAAAHEVHSKAQPMWQLATLRSGAYVELNPGAHEEMAPGRIRLSPPGYRHRMRIEPGGAICLTVQADGPFWRQVLARSLRSEMAPVFSRAPDPLPLGDVTTLKPTDIGLLLAALGGYGPAAERISDAQRAIDESAAQISLDRLAQRSGLPRGRFASAFRQATGFRPAEYRLLRRSMTACGLVRLTDQPLSHIAAESGFACQSHMTTVLRAIYGATPARIRAAARLKSERLSADSAA